MDCGPTCLRMIAKHYGRSYSLEYLRKNTFLTREGVSLLGISDAAEGIGMRTLSVRTTFERLAKEVPLPCIAHWRQNHFFVVYKVRYDKVYLADPAHGLLSYTKEEFLRGWISTGEDEGVLLLLEPTPRFYEQEDEGKKTKTGFKFLVSYLFAYKRFLIQLTLGLLLGVFLELLFPFLTQALVDFGIQNQNIAFIYAILLSQLMLSLSRASVDFIRGWILLHIGARINISIISDFLIKLMNLPMSFFDTKMIGDILQRIHDHTRIETFLTSTTLNILFSFFNLIVFGLVLAIYSMKIFLVFAIASIVVIGWVLVFMKKRAELDYKRFDELSVNQTSLFQLITGMQEIKLNNSEKQKRWEWERIQARLFQLSVKSLSISQVQEGGTLLINQFKNVLISFLAAKEVIEGKMTLGMMLAVSYIIGQLNGPVDQLITFVHSAQDAKLSLDRISEIHSRDEEEDVHGERVMVFPEERRLSVKNVSFQYEGPRSPHVLKDVTFEVPVGKVTAIVGSSGSGKTTLIKLLLRCYAPTNGEIHLGSLDLQNLDARAWREKCGVVMQDGYIFFDTIAKNIALGDERIDKDRLLKAARIACAQEFIKSLPLGYTTKVGSDGHGLSQGQKQRILIARAVYKNPEYLFFDEATSALDAKNERSVMENLGKLFEGKTVIVVAHRLSTVKNADQIIVLEQGQVVERGNHEELTRLRGIYFQLVKEQLELGT